MRKFFLSYQRIKHAVYAGLIQPWITAYRNWIIIFHENKSKAILLLCAFLFIAELLCFVSLAYFKLKNSSDRSVSDNYLLQSYVNVSHIPNTGASESNPAVIALVSSINITSRIFDNFITYTPDPTGYTVCKKNTDLSCTFNYSGRPGSVAFAYNANGIQSALVISNQLLAFILPFGVLLFIVQGFNYLTNHNREEFKSLLFRCIYTCILFFITPVILSLSVTAVNQLSDRIMGNMSISSSLKSSIDQMVSGQNDNVISNIFNSFFDLFSLLRGDLGSLLGALPVLIPLGLIILLLLYISFQFIMRFLSMYFLTAVYPFIVIFKIHPGTAGIVTGYWKQWTTFLIQQPVFLLGFKIISMILNDITKNGLSLENVIIFLGLLVFLCTINLFAAKLWGDAYTAVAQNISAGLAANIIKSSLVDKPLAYSSQIAGIQSRLSIGNIENRLKLVDFSKETGTGKGFMPDTSSDPVKEDTSGTKPAEKNKLENPFKTPIAKELYGSGYDVEDYKDGSLGVSGNFYQASDPKNDAQTLYTNYTAALDDGYDPGSIRGVFVSGMNIRDASNKRAMNEYNDKVRLIAADNGIRARDIGISSVSPDKKVLRSMQIARSGNFKENIQGIAVRNDTLPGSIGNYADNVIKIHVYKDYLNNLKR